MGRAAEETVTVHGLGGLQKSSGGREEAGAEQKRGSGVLGDREGP